MTDKKKTVLSMVLLTAGLLSCDHIAEGERLRYVRPADVSKNVLVEDFTGQTCRNCPDAAVAIHELQDTYGKTKVIAVGLYSGPFGKKRDGTYLPLTTETGDYYYNQTGVESQPSMNIDRKGLTSDNQVLMTRVHEALQGVANVMLQPVCTYDHIQRKGTLTVTAESTEDIAAGKLQVWLTEDRVVSPQILPTGKTDQAYVHDHVFRASVTDRDGCPITLQQGKPVSLSFDFDVSEAWEADCLSVVVFVFNASGVLQTEVVPLVSGSSNSTDESFNQ